jgi:hypothetical protein
MARAEKNILTQGLPGKVGNLIYRLRGNKTFVYTSSTRTVPLSLKQKEAQVKFAAAVRQARIALADETERRKFQELAVKNGKVRGN